MPAPSEWLDKLLREQMAEMQRDRAAGQALLRKMAILMARPGLAATPVPRYVGWSHG